MTCRATLATYVQGPRGQGSAKPGTSEAPVAPTSAQSIQRSAACLSYMYLHEQKMLAAPRALIRQSCTIEGQKQWDEPCMATQAVQCMRGYRGCSPGFILLAFPPNSTAPFNPSTPPGLGFINRKRHLSARIQVPGRAASLRRCILYRTPARSRHLVFLPGLD